MAATRLMAMLLTVRLVREWLEAPGPHLAIVTVFVTFGPTAVSKTMRNMRD